MGRPNAREKIINAATEVFCEKGYRETTTKEISERAGIAEITLFRNFNTKKELFFEVLWQIKGDLSKIIESLKDPVCDDGTLLKTLLIDRLTMAERNSKLLRLLLHDMQYHQEVREEFSGIYQRLLEALACYLNRNFLKTSNQEEAYFAARYFVSLIMGNIINKNFFRDACGSNAQDESDRIIGMFLNGIKD
ncbi:MAG: TetR/AcrR family transcriptional regulator [Bacillota bacterium]|nr:TetR/AcrR family transcriptional regulator [Bacillota bacterium]